MKFLSQLYDFVFAPPGAFGSESISCDTPSDDNSFDSDFMTINPANCMPMIGGIGGVDIMGNAYGMDNSHHDEPIGMDTSSIFSHNDCSSMIDHSATTSFDNGSMFDSTPAFDSGSTFDSTPPYDSGSMFD